MSTGDLLVEKLFYEFQNSPKNTKDEKIHDHQPINHLTKEILPANKLVLLNNIIGHYTSHDGSLHQDEPEKDRMKGYGWIGFRHSNCLLHMKIREAQGSFT